MKYSNTGKYYLELPINEKINLKYRLFKKELNVYLNWYNFKN